MTDTEVALEKINITKTTGPDNLPSWVLKDFSHSLAAPVTAIFNSSLREGVLPKLWKLATVIPLSKKHPPDTVENYIRPISLTTILAKVLGSLVLKWVDICVKPQIDDRQFGGMAGTCTTDVPVEMFYMWYDAKGNFVWKKTLFGPYQ